VSFDHDRPDALRPNDWELGIVTTTGATVLVSKVGGGTLGRSYDGTWHYSYSRRDHHAEGSDLTTPAVDHWQAAGIVAEFIEQNHDDIA
jgi:hypothetical protein